jgi:hypothetical protein
LEKHKIINEFYDVFTMLFEFAELFDHNAEGKLSEHCKKEESGWRGGSLIVTAHVSGSNPAGEICRFLSGRKPGIAHYNKLASKERPIYTKYIKSF